MPITCEFVLEIRCLNFMNTIAKSNKTLKAHNSQLQKLVFYMRHLNNNLHLRMDICTGL